MFQRIQQIHVPVVLGKTWSVGRIRLRSVPGSQKATEEQILLLLSWAACGATRALSHLEVGMDAMGGRGGPVKNVLDSETWEVLAGNEQTEILAPFSPGFAGEKGWG